MSGKETFESALKLSKTNANSQFVSISSRKHVKLSPKYLGNVKSGVAEQLDSQVSFFSEEVGGVPVAYNNIRLVQNMGRIIADQSCVHFDIIADFIIFKPQIGCTLSGVVNKVGKRHIGCLVHGKFNAWIPRSEQDRQKDDLIGKEIEFTVTDIFTNNDILSMKGTLNERSKQMSAKRKRKMSFSSQETIVRQNSDSLLASPSQFVNEEPFSSTRILDTSIIEAPKKKKRKKNKSSNFADGTALGEDRTASGEDYRSSFNDTDFKEPHSLKQESQELNINDRQSVDEGYQSNKPKKKKKRKSEKKDKEHEAVVGELFINNAISDSNDEHAHSHCNDLEQLKKSKKKHKKKLKELEHSNTNEGASESQTVTVKINGDKSVHSNFDESSDIVSSHVNELNKSKQKLKKKHKKEKLDYSDR